MDSFHRSGKNEGKRTFCESIKFSQFFMGLNGYNSFNLPIWPGCRE